MKLDNLYKTDNYSVYIMFNNIFLGDCIAIVYKATAQEINDDGLTSENIFLLLKPLNKIAILEKKLIIKDIVKKAFNTVKPLILRIGSECLLSIYGDSHCDCESQRISSLNAIRSNGQGVYIHMPQEARGQGLHYKVQELSLQVTGHNPVGDYIGKQSVSSASKLLLNKECLDIRSYNVLKKIFSDLGLDKFKYNFITSNPDKIFAVSKKLGIKITHSLNVVRTITPENIGEFIGKLYTGKQDLDNNELNAIIALFENQKSFIPERVFIQLAYLKRDYESGRDFHLKSNSIEKLIKYASKSDITLDNILSSVKNLNFDRNQDIDFTANIQSVSSKVRYIIKGNIFRQLANLIGLKYINYVAFEKEEYLDLISDVSLSAFGRNIKVRRTYNILGMGIEKEERIIYKITRDNKNVKILNIRLDQNLKKKLISKYRPVHTHESIVHVCKIDVDLNIVIKVLPNFEYFLTIYGNKRKIKKFCQKLKKNIIIESITKEFFENSYNKITKFTKKDKVLLIDREKNFAKKFLKV